MSFVKRKIKNPTITWLIIRIIHLEFWIVEIISIFFVISGRFVLVERFWFSSRFSFELALVGVLAGGAEVSECEFPWRAEKLFETGTSAGNVSVTLICSSSENCWSSCALGLFSLSLSLCLADVYFPLIALISFFC